MKGEEQKKCYFTEVCLYNIEDVGPQTVSFCQWKTNDVKIKEKMHVLLQPCVQIY